MYIFEDDIVGHDFLVELRKAAERGLKVVVILDILGGLGLVGSKTIKDLYQAGAEVLFYSFLLRRTHRKVLIIDEKMAFVGGVNIKKSFASWKDLQIRVSGRVVRHVVYSFVRIYVECGGKDAAIIQEIPKKSVLRITKSWFVERGIGKRGELMNEYYKKRIDAASKSIVIVTPYLLPPRWLLAHIHQALIRGVVVEILMPHATDHRFANRLNRSYASFLTSLGVRCYFASGTMNHAKAMLIDDKEGIIGSQNMDILSFGLNTEAGVFFDDVKIVKNLEEIIYEWKAGSEIFVYGDKKFHWYDIALAFTLRVSGLLPLW